MLRYALRNLLARKARLTMSLLSIALGVAFLSGVLAFGHGLRTTFDNIVVGSTPDAVVRLKGTDASMAVQPTTAVLSPADVARLAALPQVGAADGIVEGYGVGVVDRHGRLLGGTGAPTLAFNHTPVHNLLGRPMMRLERGRWPTHGQELVMDVRAAQRAGYRVGDMVTLVVPTADPSQRLRLVGTASFSGGGTAGAVLLLFDTRTAQRLFLDGRDAYTQVDLTAGPGTSQEQLAAAAAQAVPPGFTAVTGDRVAKEAQGAIDTFLGAITTFLLVFAGIAVLVCGLLIVNTFTIVVAQRTRELAVLRALGASRSQVTWSVLTEAVILAAIATATGMAGGWGLARLLAAVFSSLGLEVTGAALTLTGSAILTCTIVGVAGTATAAYLPARRAGRVAPLAAMALAQPAPGSRRRLTVGIGLLAIGGTAAVIGLLGGTEHGSAWVGAGCAIWVITLAAISGAVGWPLLSLMSTAFVRLFGVTGRLGGQNALRDPRRTGATASALMLGVAVVTTIGVLAASLNQSVDDSVNEEFAADFVVENPAFMPFPTSIGDRLATLEGVAVIARQQVLQAKLSGHDVAVSGNDTAFDRIYHLNMVAGTQRTGPGQALVLADAATAHHWHVGSRFTLRFPGGHELPLTVGGVAASTPVTAPISIALDQLAAMGVRRQDSALSIRLSPGADAAATHRRLDAAVAGLPIVSVQDKAEFANSIRGQVNQLLHLIDGLLALAVLIAVLGIVNTLGLSVIERTRELGLLRAIGVSRAQLQGVITLESVATALLGAGLGIAVGLLGGVLLRQTLASDITSLALPLPQLALFLAGAVAAGVLAAFVPAIRASRLDVLRAIATE